MNAPATTLDRSRRDDIQVTFSVDVVDGNGLDVSRERVTAVFHHGDGTKTVTHRLTDAGGRALFDGVPITPRTAMVLTAGRESLGPLVPTPESKLVVEL